MRNMKGLFLCLIIFSGLNFSSNLSSKKIHPFSVHDLVAMDRISECQLSPDGKHIVFTLRKTDLEANRGRTDLWLVDTSGKNLRRLTSHPAGDSNPCWAPDGQWIWFLSFRSGSSQVWKITTKRGDPIQVTHFPLEVGNLMVSPDGEKLAFTMQVFPDLEDYQSTKKKLDRIAKRKYSGRIYNRLFIRHWDTWRDGRRSHIFVMDKTGGAVVDIMKGMDADSPSLTWGGTEEFTFTPDSQSIIFTTKTCGKKEPWTTNYDLFLAPINGSNTPQNITKENLAWDTNPVFSSDGKTLAYLAMTRPGFEADQFQIILQDWPRGKKKILTRNWDRSPGSIVWSPNNRTIYTSASNLGQESLFAIEVKTGRVKTLHKMGTVRSIMIGKKHLFIGMDHLSSPVELYRINKNGGNKKPLTRINQQKVANTKMGKSEQFTFKGWNDETVYCYIVKPVDFNPNNSYPVAFLIHGGPQGSFGNDFHYRWNPQVYTGAGFAAVMVDFHGSVGYGQAFTDSIRGDWGGKPLQDLKKGLRTALERYPWMDRNRIVGLGASYGGYMVNWIAGNWPDRFRCLVNHDGNIDERSAYYDTEELWFPEWEHSGTPWENPQSYEKHNPVNYVKNWKTPMLVIHGALDFRVVETQGFSTFTALQRRGIPSKLLYFPDENHWVLKPHNSILWHNTVIDWLNQWIK